MRHRMLAVAGIVWGVMATAVWGAQQYAIDPAHTSVGFSIPHLVISRVNGSFPDVKGEILYDESDITKSSVNVTIQAASITTNNAARDKHLRSADFLETDKYPEMTFKSLRIEPKGDGYVCVGTLTLHGVSREVEIPFKVLGTIKDPQGKTRMAIDASLKLNRQDYGVSWNKALETGGMLVGNDVDVHLSIEAIQQAAPTGA